MLLMYFEIKNFYDFIANLVKNIHDCFVLQNITGRSDLLRLKKNSASQISCINLES